MLRDTCPILETALWDSPASYPGPTQPSAGGQARSKLKCRGPTPLGFTSSYAASAGPKFGGVAGSSTHNAYVRKLTSLKLGFAKSASGDNSAGLSFSMVLDEQTPFVVLQCQFPRDVAVSLLLLFLGQCCRSRKLALLLGDAQVDELCSHFLLMFATSPCEGLVMVHILQSCEMTQCSLPFLVGQSLTVCFLR